jgi:hypothetical protein
MVDSNGYQQYGDPQQFSQEQQPIYKSPADFLMDDMEALLAGNLLTPEERQHLEAAATAAAQSLYELEVAVNQAKINHAQGAPQSPSVGQSFMPSSTSTGYSTDPNAQ